MLLNLRIVKNMSYKLKFEIDKNNEGFKSLNENTYKIKEKLESFSISTQSNDNFSYNFDSVL